MENSSGRLVQPGISASSTKLVGQAFEQNMKVIWSWLMNDEVSIIGIYGMAGVGKTTMLRCIHYELLQIPEISQHVCWVTMPQDFTVFIKTLQNLIAKWLDLDLSSKDDDLSRAKELTKELTKKKKWILILDNLWNSFVPQDVGIPISLKGCKLIIITQSKMVCQQMENQNNIRVDPLYDEEDWTLFKEKLGYDVPPSLKVEGIAVNVVRECAGLPLGIVTLAENLRGVDDLYEWRITLKRLKESNFWDIEDQLFQILRKSYDCLDDSAQQCFVYCALFDERHKIEREVLIELFIEEGIIKEMNREVALKMGHSILNRLEDVCLLERIDNGDAVKMHDLLRDMAIQILDEYSLVMVNFTFYPSSFSFL